jgi:hypothetical protein
VQQQRDFSIDNQLVPIHFITKTIRWTGLVPWDFESPFSGSLISTFLVISSEKVHSSHINHAPVHASHGTEKHLIDDSSFITPVTPATEDTPRRVNSLRIVK